LLVEAVEEKYEEAVEELVVIELALPGNLPVVELPQNQQLQLLRKQITQLRLALVARVKLMESILHLQL
jgi:hypothetical protein